MDKKETVLVTGGTGAVGVYCILKLLQKGYKVKTTLRSVSRKNEVVEMLKTGGITLFDNLQFVGTDLTKDRNWDTAMNGCKYVLHIASPTHTNAKVSENEMIRPAVEGTLRVLKSARDAGVKRVVMTSSFGAVGFSNKDLNSITTEDNWTNPDEKGLSVYEKSKVLAEKAAWEFIKKEGQNLELATINPVAIFGPSLGTSKSPSLGILKFLTNGSAKAIPNIPLNVVDIRDVATLHILAMTNPNANGQRFIATADGKISIPEIAALIKATMPKATQKIPSKILPNWVLHFASLFNSQAKQSVTLLKINRNVSNDKAKKTLGWLPTANNEEAIIASMESLIKYNLKK